MSDATNRLALGLPPQQENLMATGAPTLADQWRFNKAMETQPQPAPTTNALWPPNNPIGTERLRLNEPSVGVARGEIDPVVDRWPTGKPRTLSEYQGIEDTGQNLFDQLSMMTPTGHLGPATAGSVRGGSMRVPRGPRPPEPGGGTSLRGFLGEFMADNSGAMPRRARAAPLPPPPGARSTETLASRLGSNADAHFASMGLPAHADIVPSTRTTPFTEAELKSGAPRGSVFDLSDTWKVPDVPQVDLVRMDPNAGGRRGVSAHVQDAIDNPELAAKLRFVAEHGVRVGGAYWYNAEPLKGAMTSELGGGPGADLFQRYLGITGATSAGSEVGQNVRAASYYLGKERAGDPVRSVEDIIPPYGHKMQREHIRGYAGLAGDTLDPAINPKRSGFVANLGGNQQPLTGDSHYFKLVGMLSEDPRFLVGKAVADNNYPALGIAKGESRNWRDEVMSGRITMEQALQHPHMWRSVPEPKDYGAMEAWTQRMAREMGLSTAQLQASLWVGGGRVTGLRSLPTSFMGIMENRLQQTADKRGGTPREALLDFIHGRAPLLTPLAAAGAGGLAATRDQDD